MKIHITKHAIERFQSRYRHCDPEFARRQIEAAYATGTHMHTYPDGKEVHVCGDLHLVKCPNGHICTVY